ncbi:hypothetical protein MS3_00011063 [Schistosoma haematobium]|uniref:UPF0506 domain-containing protein n=1 Tax=Schistosoma haematobium TaxID=6185 RepID=A0A922IL84_SCHHA|nr:hypothetical protein MS3_00011063 [Schistosoma haematobium]KAH9581566.1 hypothetical protein MS3_00011063 [Schistosoma haematobium]
MKLVKIPPREPTSSSLYTITFVLKHLNQLHCFEQHSSPFQHHENGLRHSTHLPENGPDNLHTVLLQHGANILSIDSLHPGFESRMRDRGYAMLRSPKLERPVFPVQTTNCSNDITDDSGMNAPMANFKCIKSGECRTIGQNCSKTVFSPCCEQLYCGLNTLFTGKCHLCLAGGYFCWTSQECCSGKCSWLKCTDPIKDVVEKLTVQRDCLRGIFVVVVVDIRLWNKSNTLNEIRLFALKNNDHFQIILFHNFNALR